MQWRAGSIRKERCATERRGGGRNARLLPSFVVHEIVRPFCAILVAPLLPVFGLEDLPDERRVYE